MVKNLRKLREELGLTQQRLAELTGISKSRIYSYESLDREPDIAGLITLADFFSVSIDYLVGKEPIFMPRRTEQHWIWISLEKGSAAFGYSAK